MNEQQMINRAKKVAQECGQPVVGYLTNFQTFFMEANFAPQFREGEKIISQFLANPTEEKAFIRVESDEPEKKVVNDSQLANALQKIAELEAKLKEKEILAGPKRDVIHVEGNATEVEPASDVANEMLTPSIGWLKKDIQTYMARHSIEFSLDDTEAELLLKIDVHNTPAVLDDTPYKDRTPTYITDEDLTVEQKEAIVSKPTEHLPDMKWLVKEIKSWMDNEKIAYEIADTKKVLLEKINAVTNT